jgi:hypothetical protein
LQKEEKEAMEAILKFILNVIELVNKFEWDKK